MIRRPPRSTQSRSSAASDVYKRQEQTLLQIVSALERYQDRLNIFVDWFNLHTLESAAAHVAEAATTTETLVDRVMEQIHNYDPPVVAGAAGGAGALAGQQAQGPTAKPVMALKPEKLSFDSNLGQVRRKKQRFRAFHASSNLRVLSLPDQQAFLIACIDDEVANRIHRLVTETTPLFPNQARDPAASTLSTASTGKRFPSS